MGAVGTGAVGGADGVGESTWTWTLGVCSASVVGVTAEDAGTRENKNEYQLEIRKNQQTNNRFPKKKK